MKGTDFPGGDLSGVRAIAFRNAFVCAVCFALGYLVLSIPALPSSSLPFLLGLVLIAGGFICGIVYLINWLVVCAWSFEYEREFRAKEQEWLDKKD